MIFCSCVWIFWAFAVSVLFTLFSAVVSAHAFAFE